jgi:hypothetical protein
MPLRPSITPYIARLRRELGACADAYEDEALQDALDARRISVRKRALRASIEEATGAADYTVHCTEGNDWEAVALYDQDGAAIPAANILLDEGNVGTWHFSQEYTSVYLTGHRHDLMGAAADLWERRASDLAHQIDTASGDLRLSLSQAHKQAQERAAHYRGRARPRNVKATRSDVARGGPHLYRRSSGGRLWI